MLFFPDPTIRAVGLDISEHVFRLVDIRRGPFYDRRLRLHRYSEERIADGVMVNGEFQKPDKAAAHLKNLLKRSYGSSMSGGVIVALPETKTFIKVINVKRPENLEDLEKELMTEAELHIPTSLSDLYIDWQPIVDPKLIAVGKPVGIMLAAAPKSVIESYSAVLDEAELVPVAFEIEAQSIIRACIPWKDDGKKAVGIIDFGATRSSFIVYDKGTIQFTVSIPLSGDAITKGIAQKLSVELPEAERTKRQCGVDAHKCGLLIWQIMEPFLSEMSSRVFDAIAFYRDHFDGGRDLDEILLCGGGANMARMDELLTELMKVPVRRADPWVNLVAGRSTLPPEIILSSTTAVGLALRQFMPVNGKKSEL